MSIQQQSCEQDATETKGHELFQLGGKTQKGYYSFHSLQEDVKEYENKFITTFEYNQSGSRVFFLFEDYIEFIRTFLTLKDNKGLLHFHEFILGSSPFRMFFDIDCSQIERITKEDLLADFVDAVLSYLEERNIKYPKERISVCSCHTEEKHSYHIIFPDISIPDVYTMNIIGKETKKRMEYGEYLDCSYQKNKNFRLPFNCKYNKTTPIVFNETWKYDDDTITFEFQDNAHPTVRIFEECIVIASHIDSTATGFGDHQASTIQNIDSDILNKIYQLKDQNLIPDGLEIVEGQTNFITLKNKSGFDCPICKRHHEKENAYLFVNQKGIYFKCFRNSQQSLLISKTEIDLPSVSSSPASGNISDEIFDSELNKIVRSPLVIDDMHLDKFTKKYIGNTISTKEAERKMVLDLLRVFRYIDTSKSYVIYKKKIAEDITFEFMSKTEMLKILDGYHFYQQAATGSKDGKRSFKQLFESYKIYFLARGVHFLPQNERMLPDLNRLSALQKENLVERINIFNGWKSSLVDEVNDDVVAPILFHIKEIFCSGNEEYYNYFIHWLADLVQRPDKKIGTAIVLQSPQGAGKNIFFDWFNNYVIGASQSTTIQSLELIVGKFNSVLENKMLIIVNEICSKKRMVEQFEIMKTLITDTTQQIERKGLDPIRYDSYTRFVFCSNSEKPVHIEETDRRYFVLKFDKPTFPNYFTTLATVLTQDTANHFYTYLMNLDLASIDLRVIPMTEGKQELIDLSTPKDILFIKEHYWNDYLPTQTVYDAYVLWCERNGHQKRSTKEWFSKNISKYLEYKKTKSARKIKRIILPGEDTENMTQLQNNEDRI